MIAKLAAIFFLISDSLLYPVMLGLLIGLVLAIWRFGRCVRFLASRRFERKLRRELIDALETDDVERFGAALTAEGRTRFATPLTTTLSALWNARDDFALLDKRLAQARLTLFNDSPLLTTLMKLGPAFGLMGTLIPLGPALVGLATGDLNVLAQNLGIAFATTVIGLTISAIAFCAATLEKRANANDLVVAVFAAERIERNEDRADA